MIDTNDYEQYNITTFPYNKTRKSYLAKQGLTKCDRCPYHRHENRDRIPYERKAKKSMLKSRESIRKFEEVEEGMLV